MAASTGKRDLIFTPSASGGWYENTQRVKNRSGRRYFYIDGLTSGSNGERMKEAADYVDATYTNYPDDSSLKIFSARAMPLSHPEHALVIATYKKRSLDDNDPSTDTTIAHIKSKMIRVEWYGDSTTGLLFVAADGVKAAEYRDIPVWDISLYTELASSPLTAIGGNVGLINSGTFALGGHTFAAYELLFQGVDQKVIWDGSTATFRVGYHYRYRGSNPTGPDGWYGSYKDTAGLLAHRILYKTAAFVDPPLA